MILPAAGYVNHRSRTSPRAIRHVGLFRLQQAV
jgi:hypothetical protein